MFLEVLSLVCSLLLSPAPLFPFMPSSNSYAMLVAALWKTQIFLISLCFSDSVVFKKWKGYGNSASSIFQYHMPICISMSHFENSLFQPFSLFCLLEWSVKSSLLLVVGYHYKRMNFIARCVCSDCSPEPASLLRVLSLVLPIPWGTKKVEIRPFNNFTMVSTPIMKEAVSSFT